MHLVSYDTHVVKHMDDPAPERNSKRKKSLISFFINALKWLRISLDIYVIKLS